VWPEIIRDLERGQLQPVYDARGRDFDLAESPMPRFDLLDITSYNRLTVQTQRGCPYSCDFCAASIRLNPRFIGPLTDRRQNGGLPARKRSMLVFWGWSDVAQ
jgi:radical SAM superfamily enzyme YgiQ (UPF0313 family)